MFPEITSHVVKLFSLQHLSHQVSEDLRCPLQHWLLFQCPRKTPEASRPSHCGHRRWSTPLWTPLMSKSCFPEQHLQLSSWHFHVTSHSFSSAHMFCLIPTLIPSWKQEYWWTLGCRCTRHTLVFSITGAFLFPLWMFFSRILLLCSTVVPQKPCIVI